MKLGIYGGTFDPIHVGHLSPVREARHRLGLDRVMYLPTARPPHKLERRFAPAWARYTMVELALLAEDGLFASPWEMSSERPTYTIDTLEHFAGADIELYLLLGSDAFAGLTTWKSWQRLVTLAELAVMPRPAWALDSVETLAPELRQVFEEKRLHILDNMLVPISSTEIRRAIAADEQPAPDLVPPLVLNYIRKYDLYR